MLSFSPPLRFECGDCTFVWLHTVCTTTTLLRIPHLGEHCPDVSLAEINHAAVFVFLPYEIRGLHGICDGNLELMFHWSVMLSVCHPCPPPLQGGVPGIETATTFLLTSIYCDDSVHGGLLDKLI